MRRAALIPAALCTAITLLSTGACASNPAPADASYEFRAGALVATIPNDLGEVFEAAQTAVETLRLDLAEAVRREGGEARVVAIDTVEDKYTITLTPLEDGGTNVRIRAARLLGDREGSRAIFELMQRLLESE